MKNRDLRTEISEDETGGQTSSANFLANVVERADDGVFIVSKSGSFLFANPKGCEMTGYSEAQLRGITVADTYPPEELPKLRQIFDNLDDNAEPIRFERTLVRKDGIRMPVEVSVTVRDDGNLQSITRDISKRKASERENQELKDKLERQDRLFRALAEHATDSVIIMKVDGTITYASKSLERVLGWTPEERVGKNAFEFLHPDDLQRVASLLQANLQNADAIVTAEYRYKHKDGSWRVMSSVARNCLANPAVEGIVVNSRDVTEKRAAESALMLSEQRFRLATLATHEVIWERDLTNNRMWWSDNLNDFRWFDPAETEHTWEWCMSKVHRDDLSRVVDGISKVVSDRQQHWSAELRIMVRDGKVAHVLCRAFFVYDESGRPIRMVGSMQDITEKKQLETQFLRAQRMESIGTLAGGIAHDLNNILAPIVMGTQLLQAEVKEPEAQGLLKTMMQSAERGTDIIRQLLTFARGAEGEKAAINLRHLTRDMANIATQTFPKNIQVSVRCDSALWLVDGNVTQLHQVLLNLCVNARDAMADGGQLCISAENVDLAVTTMGPVQIPPGKYVRVSVTDTGCGMPPEIHDKIFEPFFTTKGPHKGTGLGLSTVLGIVKSHKGYVEVKSEVGKGSELSVLLPAVFAAEEVKNGKTQGSRLPRGNGQTILLVDDEAAIRETSGRILKDHGYKVLTARDGIEALGMLTQTVGGVDLVLTDLMMPFMDGVTLVRSIQRMMPQIKIAVSSGLVEGGPTGTRTAELKELGIHSVVKKPYAKESLLAAVAEELAQSKSSLR